MEAGSVRVVVQISDSKDGSGMPAQDAVDLLREKHTSNTLGLIAGSNVLEVADSDWSPPTEGPTTTPTAIAILEEESWPWVVFALLSASSFLLVVYAKVKGLG